MRRARKKSFQAFMNVSMPRTVAAGLASGSTAKEVGFVTVLVNSDNDEPIEAELGDTTLEVVTCRGGAALIRLVEGKLDDHLVKGRNAFLSSAVRAAVSLGGRRSETDEPADVFRV
ncbi:hypothetical protein [Nonomuraea dietziae]|uniref:hypothetical protein n=1 Tax=Nonomuraea dietziae TaxID=65515 RepID=UPI0034414C46